MEAGVALNPFLLLGKVPRRVAMSCSGFCVCACALVTGTITKKYLEG